MSDSSPLRPAAAPVPRLQARTTETGLQLPSFGRILVLFGRALRRRCPHCGRGPVLRPLDVRDWGATHERCSGCGFRFTRSDDRYFAGALFANLLLTEAAFALGFLAVVLGTWPEVPWDGLTYGAAACIVVGPVLTYPLAKVLWLAMDVLVRPVTRAELE